MGRNEEICDGVCVNTWQNDDHCGACFVACNPDFGEFCDQGECWVITPYGGPMPASDWL